MITMRVIVWLAAVLTLAVLIPPPPPAVAEVAPPRLIAHWERPGVALIVWHEPGGMGVTCLSRNGMLIQCWDNLPAERYILLLGSVEPLDGTHHPVPGDTFVLEQDNATFRANLEGVIYLPVLQV